MVTSFDPYFVGKIAGALSLVRFEILDSSLHVMIVLKAQFGSDDFTFVRI